MGFCAAFCSGICSAIGVAVIGVVAYQALNSIDLGGGGSSGGQKTCDGVQCLCPPDWPNSWCADEGQCYGGRPDPRCNGAQNLHRLSDDSWCWDQTAVTFCAKSSASSPAPSGRKRGFIRSLIGRVARWHELIDLDSLLSPAGNADGKDCTDVSCVCGPGWRDSWCADGQCFGGRPEAACQGKQNTEKISQDAWCWEGQAVTFCEKKVANTKRKGGFLRKIVAALSERLEKTLNTNYFPALKAVWRMRISLSQSAALSSCEILANYGWNDPASKEPIMAMGALDMAVKALKKFPDDKLVQRGCLNSIAALSLYNRAVSLRAGELGVVEMTADVWRKWWGDPSMVFANYFGCYQDFAPENRVRMRVAGGIELALKACGEGGPHFWDPSAQFLVWCGFSSFHSHENHMEFRRLGGVRHLNAAYRDHPTSYRVREEILQATKGLCAHRIIRDELAELGFVPLLVSSLKEAADDPQVQALALETLRMFVDKNDTLRKAVVADGGIVIGLTALAKHAAALLNTRSAWDSQNVYGELNDNQYNVPGGAAELLYSLALDGPETRKEFIKAQAISQLKLAVQATQNRVQSVKLRTFQGACATMWLMRSEAAENEEVQRELMQAELSSGCPQRGTAHPLVITNDIPFEA